MTIWRRMIFAVLIGLGTMAAYAQCTSTLNPGQNVTAAVETAAPGATICLNSGTYLSATTGLYSDPNSFAVSKSVKILGLGATPASVILRGGATSDYAVKFFQYGALGLPNGATLENLTIDTSNGGVLVFDFGTSTRLNSITLKDLVIQTKFPNGTAFGVLLQNTDRINVDNVTVTSSQSGFYLLNSSDALVMNSTVTATAAEGAIGLAVLGGTGNRIIGNTIGSPKVGPTYSFNGGGVVFYNTTANRFENNTIQGQRDDGLDYTVTDLLTPFGIPFQGSVDNYVGKNNVISTGFADGRPGGSGIWSNCGSNNMWIYANDAQGVVECGLCVWQTRSNMALGNNFHNNGIAGIVVSGGAETPPFCTANGGAFMQKPTFNFLHSNYNYFNRNDQLFVRTADTTEISRNFASPRNGFGGPVRTDCQTAFCQSAITLDTDSAAPNSNGARVVANTSHENIRGIQSDDGKTIGIEFAFNRMLQSSLNRYNLAGTTNWDGGPNLGGNYWTQFSASGNPSTATPYGTSGANNSALGVFDSLSNTTGRIVDRYPYQSEDLGRGYGVTVYEPRAGASVAQGTRRTVRWNAPGCMYMDLSLDGSTSLATNVPNTGYAVVTIPGGATVGTHNIAAACKDSAGTVRGSGTSPSFSVSASTLKIMAPGRDDVFNANTLMVVAWKKTAAITSVNVDLSTDGGVTFPTVFGPFTGTTARVTLPNIPSTAYAVMRVRSGATIDHTDGVFAIRGTSGAGFANVPSGRKFVMGGLERLEWASPQNSRLVDITATVLGIPKTVATNLPDRGNFDWVVPDLGVGTVTLQISFKTTTGGAISSSSNALGSTLRPSTITFGTVATLGIGATTNVTATANSGLAVSLTSLTTGVCTVSGTTVTGVALGTCTIAGNQAGNATYAPASQATVSFTVATVADPPRLANISTRMQVLTGNDVLIGGFVIGGSAGKSVVIRARGPSLLPFGITNPVGNPFLQLFSGQTVIASNDDWQSAGNSAQISASGFAPSSPQESAILATLSPGAYTAIVSGVGNTTGVGIVEVFEVDHPEVPLVNISTRGQVLTGNDVMIGGFVIQGSGPQTVVVRARGPSLIPFGITNALANPVLQLFSGQTVIASNDDWQTAANAAQLSSSGFAPSSSLESAILITLQPGAYTAIVTGAGGGTGVGIVEVFAQ